MVKISIENKYPLVQCQMVDFVSGRIADKPDILIFCQIICFQLQNLINILPNILGLYRISGRGRIFRLSGGIIQPDKTQYLAGSRIIRPLPDIRPNAG